MKKKKKIEKKENKLLEYKYLKFKQFFMLNRGYIADFKKEKDDLLFDEYRYSLIRRLYLKNKFLNVSLFKRLRWRMFRRRIFIKIARKRLAERIRNELLLSTPVLLRAHIKAKSWRYIKIKKKNIRRLKNVKKMVLRYFPNYRESYILKEQLNRTYFWLTNTTKRQVLNIVKSNKLKITSDKMKYYFFLKNKFLKKRLKFFNNKRKYYYYFLKTTYNIYFKSFNLLMLKMNKLILLLSFKNMYMFKFLFLKNIIVCLNFFKKMILRTILRDAFNVSFSEVLSLQKGKLKVRKKIKRKLRFYYNLYKKKNKIFKLKVRMVNSNFFITLTDYNDKVLIYRSTGQVSENRKKKVKLSPYLVTKMMYSIINKLKRKKIKYLFFFVNSKINRHINNVMKCLKTVRYTKILKVLFSKPLAHHFGTRKPKLRRL